MDIESLKKFLVVAQLNNLQTASNQLNQTPGALSKVVKRLENELNCQLFDRIGRNIKLNRNGEKFLQYAYNFIHEADPVISEFSGSNRVQTVNISGPSVLMQYWLPIMMNQIEINQFEFNINIAWEGEALGHLTSGHAHLALVTEVAGQGVNNRGFAALNFGETSFKIIASKQHEIMENYSAATGLNSSQLGKYKFACPSVSPFCGIKRGVGSDGWPDNDMPRNIAYRCNDFSLLLGLVKQGRALAYVPDFVAIDHEFAIIDINDQHHACDETIQLLYKPSVASGWLNKLIVDFKTITHSE